MNWMPQRICGSGDTQKNMVLHGWPRYFSEKNCLKYRLKDRMLQCKHFFQSCSQNSTANVKPFKMFKWKGSLRILTKQKRRISTVVLDVSRKYTSGQAGNAIFQLS